MEDVYKLVIKLLYESQHKEAKYLWVLFYSKWKTK